MPITAARRTSHDRSKPAAPPHVPPARFPSLEAFGRRPRCKPYRPGPPSSESLHRNRLMHSSKIGRGSTGGNGFGRLALACPRQYDLELSEQPGLRLDVDAAAVLLYDNVVAHREAKPSP